MQADDKRKELLQVSEDMKESSAAVAVRTASCKVGWGGVCVSWQIDVKLLHTTKFGHLVKHNSDFWLRCASFSQIFSARYFKQILKTVIGLNKVFCLTKNTRQKQKPHCVQHFTPSHQVCMIPCRNDKIYYIF